jgi:hypothetical protein
MTWVVVVSPVVMLSVLGRLGTGKSILKLVKRFMIVLDMISLFHQ